MIHVQNLSKRYADQAVVDNVSFQVDHGESFVLLGRSGSGKTTTLKMINRLVEPDGGRIEIEGRDIMEQDPVELRRHIGYVIQHHGLFPHYTVAENIGVVPRLLGEEERELRSRVPELLESVGLDPERFPERYPRELSGGEAQRVAIARAIAARPPLLLMDEPFSALDPITRTEVRSRFRELACESDIATVIVTHDVAEAVELADTICLIDAGRVVRIGPPRAFLFGEPDPTIDSFFRTARFETELKVVRVGELVAEVAEGKDTRARVEILEPDETLYGLLDRSADRMGEPVEVVIEEMGERVRTTPAGLLEAWLRLRKTGEPG